MGLEEHQRNHRISCKEIKEIAVVVNRADSNFQDRINSIGTVSTEKPVQEVYQAIGHTTI